MDAEVTSEEFGVIRDMVQRAARDNSHWFQWTVRDAAPVLVDDAAREVPDAPRDIVFYVRMQQAGLLWMSVTLQQGLRIELTDEAYRKAGYDPPERVLD